MPSGRPAVRVRDRGQFDLMLLAIVAQGPVDGYGLASALTEQTGGRVSVPSRVVFTSLHRLTRNRMVRRTGQSYVLTDAGARSMTAKRREWDTLDKAMRVVLERADADGRSQ